VTLAMIRQDMPQVKYRSGNGKDRSAITIQLAELQGWMCFWCGEKMTNDNPLAPTYRTLEHVVPRASGRGGTSKRANLRAACRECNEIRGAFTHIVQRLKQTRRIEEQLASCQKALARHRVTMAGRCYFCKFRFHLKEWIYKFRKRKEAA